jgi:hypothetical protein
MPTPTDCRRCGRPYYGAAGLLCGECEREAKRPLDAVDCSLSLAELLAWCVYAHQLNEKEARCVGGVATIERALRAAWIEEHSPKNSIL